MQSPEDNHLPNLICTRPFEECQLAIKPARKAVGTIQADAGILRPWRNKYATDVAPFNATARIVPNGFQTISPDNNY